MRVRFYSRRQIILPGDRNAPAGERSAVIANELEHPVVDALRAFALGTLGDAEISEIALHLDRCSECCTKVDEFLTSERFVEKLRGVEPAHDAATEDEAGLKRAVRALLREVHDSDSGLTPPIDLESGTPREVGEYTVLREVGRGGMGVVYQARQRSLRRVVALKMILAGEFASESQRHRFRREAELAARMQHPNIVQIHEVALFQGRPFLALEYVEGGTLADRQARSPLDPRASARLVEVLARAVHHAHMKAIIHRDLKPANILLEEVAEAPSAAEGAAEIARGGPYLIPKITDFGLARSSERVSGLTESGTVMGTPSYISPEQARGEKDLGPATDIYSLGAILYDLLARRPPFLADSPLRTVQQVVEQDPARPSKWLADVPVDLETISLKCLEKEPSRRYPTAEALADDLRNWLDGQGISARPARTLERAVKWCKRRPALAASLLAIGALLIAVTIISTVAAIRLRSERNAVVAESNRARRSEEQHRIALVDALFNAAPATVPFMLETLGPSAEVALPLLRDRFDHAAARSNAKLRAAIGLTALGDSRANYLLDAVIGTHPAECVNLALAFRKIREPGIDEALLGRALNAKEPRERARYAILLLELGDVRGAQPLLAFSRNPNPRTTLIDEFQSWHGDLAALASVLRNCRDADCRAGLCAAIGGVDSETLSTETREALTATLLDLYKHAPDAGTHSAADWALRQWSTPVPALDKAHRPAPDREWFINQSGMTMIGLAPGGYLPAGPTIVLVTRPYFQSDREISLAQFEQFINDPSYPASEKPLPWNGPIRQTCPGPEFPVNNVFRREAVLFCNWLSDREGRRRCYGTVDVLGNTTCDFDADGYRLPTEAEWDYAHRAGAKGEFFFGDDPRWLTLYAHTSSLQTAPCASKMPSRWGFFDMVGNVWELCWDEFAPLPATLVIDPSGPYPRTGAKCVGRGGAFDSGSFDTRAWMRTTSANPGPSLGFRVVCREPVRNWDAVAARDAAIDRAADHFADNFLLYHWRAEFRAQAGRWNDAAVSLRRAVALDPADVSESSRYASVLVQIGEMPTYRQFTQGLLERFGGTTNPKIANGIAIACLLAPEGVADLEPVLKVADVAVAGRAKFPMVPDLGELPRALADYRMGRLTEADARLTKHLARDDLKSNPGPLAAALLVHAMTQYRLGRYQAALDTFAKAEQLVKNELQALGTGKAVKDWEGTLIAEILDREARAILKPSPTP